VCFSLLDGVDVVCDFFWTGLETRPTDNCDSNVPRSCFQSGLIHNCTLGEEFIAVGN